MIINDQSYNLTPAMKIQFADFIETYRRQPAVAESLVQALVKSDPNFSEGTFWLSSFYSRQGKYARSIEMLERWLTRKPEDQQARAQLQQLKTLAQADSLAKASRSGSAPTDTASGK
jgi:predicted Zn-dependent protease